MKAKRILIALGCVAVIAACAVWTWRTQFAAPKFNVALHVGLGQTMAEQTASALNNTGKIVIVTLDSQAFPELGVQMQEFKKILAQHSGLAIKETYTLETDDKPKYHFGSGLSGRRYVRLVNKNLSAAAFVSFVGAPELTDKELAEMKKVPKLIAECRSADKLKRLFDAKAIHTAVVGRFEYPTPIKGTPGNPREWVEQRFQIVTAEKAASLPSGSDDIEAPKPK
jgi:hypothetical protein